MTYRYVVYDLQKSFNASFDDADFTFSQILYWVMLTANKMRVQQNLATNSDLFTSTFNNVTVAEDDKGRKYIDIPVQIMDLPNNAGVVYLTYNEETCKCEGPVFAQRFFQGTTLGQVHHIYMDEYTKPSAHNPYYYRVGHKVDGSNVNRIYLLGVDCVPVESLEIAIKASLDPRFLCDLDEQIPLPDEMIFDLTSQVLQLGRFIMMMPSERINTGEDESEVDYRALYYQQRNANLASANTASSASSQD
jgi:hypothetical protein